MTPGAEETTVEAPSSNGQGVPTVTPSSTGGASPDGGSSAALGLAVWVVAAAIGLGLTAGRSVLESRPWAAWVFGAALVFIVSIPFWFEKSREWIKKSAGRQGALLTFGVAPILLGIVLAIVLASPTWQFALIRVGFIIVACLTPASLYYLFVVTRKGSLLNEFVANLARLGLLTPRAIPATGPDADARSETETERRRRVEAYLQKFEAAFGQIPDEVRGLILDSPRDAARRQVTVTRATVGEVFVAEAAAPVVTATFFMALLWLVTLPPVKLDVASSLFRG